MAYAPEGHGNIERAHRELHRFLNGLVNAVADMEEEDWPQGIPLAEMNARGKALASPSDGVTPYSLTHGWQMATPLTSTLQAIASIPKDLPLTKWMRGIRATSSFLAIA